MKYLVCPGCKGSARGESVLYQRVRCNGDIEETTLVTLKQQPCKACDGQGVIPLPKIKRTKKV